MVQGPLRHVHIQQPTTNDSIFSRHELVQLLRTCCTRAERACRTLGQGSVLNLQHAVRARTNKDAVRYAQDGFNSI